MRITRQAQSRSCAVCERTLLMGERATRFAPNGDGEYVDVCPLCQEIALDAGWVKEGSPTTPMVPAERRKRQGPLSSFLGFRREPSAAPIADEPILRRLSEPELAMVEAADIFNASQFRRTVEGIAKSLGDPNVSIVPLSGVNTEVVITVCWDISWYQYRVTFDSGQPVRLEQRGHDPGELMAQFSAWNARLSEDGRLVPEIARV
jgi:hypothetical protein